VCELKFDILLGIKTEHVIDILPSQLLFMVLKKLNNTTKADMH